MSAIQHPGLLRKPINSRGVVGRTAFVTAVATDLFSLC